MSSRSLTGNSRRPFSFRRVPACRSYLKRRSWRNRKGGALFRRVFRTARTNLFSTGHLYRSSPSNTSSENAASSASCRVAFPETRGTCSSALYYVRNAPSSFAGVYVRTSEIIPNKERTLERCNLVVGVLGSESARTVTAGPDPVPFYEAAWRC